MKQSPGSLENYGPSRESNAQIVTVKCSKCIFLYSHRWSASLGAEQVERVLSKPSEGAAKCLRSTTFGPNVSRPP